MDQDPIHTKLNFFRAQPEVFGKVDARHRLGLDFLRRAKKIGDSVKIRGL